PHDPSQRSRWQTVRRSPAAGEERDPPRLALLLRAGGDLELQSIPRIDREHLRRRLPERRHVLLWRALEDRERSVVDRDDELRLEPLARGAGLRERGLWRERLHLAAVAKWLALLGREPDEVDHGLDAPGRPEHLGAGTLGEIGGVARSVGPTYRTDMVAVAVRDEDQVDLAELGEVLVLGRRLGIAGQEGIDHDHLAARRGDLERRLTAPEPLDLPGLGHQHRARQRKAEGDDER